MPGALYLYCVTPAGYEPAASLAGLGDVPVRVVQAGGIAVWASELPESGLDFSVETARRHHTVVEAATSEEITPVPLRFGQRVASESEARELLEADRAGWRARLDRVAGAVEFGVRVLDPRREAPARDMRPAAAEGGREYLTRLAQQQETSRRRTEEAERVGRSVQQIVADAALGQRVEVLGTAHGVAAIAHLVARTAVPEYRSRIQRVRTALPELTFFASGPWPPYSFVS